VGGLPSGVKNPLQSTTTNHMADRQPRPWSW
jgi:hypothetical protein